MLPSLYIPFHFLSGPLDSHLTSIQVVSHPDAGPHICVSPQSMWRLSYIQFPKIASQLYPGPSQSYPECYTCFSSPSQYPSPVSTVDHKIFVSTPSMYCLTSGNVHEFNIPPPCCISPPSRCRYSHLISIQVAYPLQPALIGQPPFWFHLITIQVETWISPPSTSRLTPTKAPYSYISLPSRSRFTSTHVQTFASHLNPGNESTLFCSWELHLSSQVPLQGLAGLKFTSSVHPILASLAPRSPNSCNLPHLCTVSSVSRSLDSNLTSIHVMSHLQPGPEFGVSPHSRSHVTSIQVTRIAHHLHPSPIPTFPCIKICSLTQSRSHRTPIHFLRLTSHLNLRS